MAAPVPSSAGFDRTIQGRCSLIQRRTTVLSATQHRNELQNANSALVPVAPASATAPLANTRATRVVRFNVADADGETSPVGVGDGRSEGVRRGNVVQRARQRAATLAPARGAVACAKSGGDRCDDVDRPNMRVMTAEEEQERLRAMYLRVPNRALTTVDANMKEYGRKVGRQLRPRPELPHHHGQQTQQHLFQRQRETRQSIRGTTVAAQRPDFLRLLQAWYIRDVRADTNPKDVKALLRREALRFDPDVLACLDHLWQIIDADGDGAVQRDEYIAMSMRLWVVFVGDGDVQKSRQVAESEWDADRQGHDNLNRARFRQSWFQLTDTWTEGISSNAYCNLLQDVIEAISVDLGAGERGLRDEGDVLSLDVARQRRLESHNSNILSGGTSAGAHGVCDQTYTSGRQHQDNVETTIKHDDFFGGENNDGGHETDTSSDGRRGHGGMRIAYDETRGGYDKATGVCGAQRGGQDKDSYSENSRIDGFVDGSKPSRRILKQSPGQGRVRVTAGAREGKGDPVCAKMPHDVTIERGCDGTMRRTRINTSSRRGIKDIRRASNDGESPSSPASPSWGFGCAERFRDSKDWDVPYHLDNKRVNSMAARRAQNSHTGAASATRGDQREQVQAKRFAFDDGALVRVCVAAGTDEQRAAHRVWAKYFGVCSGSGNDSSNGTRNDNDSEGATARRALVRAWQDSSGDTQRLEPRLRMSLRRARKQRQQKHISLQGSDTTLHTLGNHWGGICEDRHNALGRVLQSRASELQQQGGAQSNSATTDMRAVQELASHSAYLLHDWTRDGDAAVLAELSCRSGNINWQHDHRKTGNRHTVLKRRRTRSTETKVKGKSGAYGGGFRDTGKWKRKVAAGQQQMVAHSSSDDAGDRSFMVYCARLGISGAGTARDAHGSISSKVSLVAEPETPMNMCDSASTVATPTQLDLLQCSPKQPHEPQSNASALLDTTEAIVSPSCQAKLASKATLAAASPGLDVIVTDNIASSSSPASGAPSSGLDVPPHSPQLTYSQYTSQTGLVTAGDPALLALSHTSSIVADCSIRSDAMPTVQCAQPNQYRSREARPSTAAGTNTKMDKNNFGVCGGPSSSASSTMVQRYRSGAAGARRRNTARVRPASASCTRSSATLYHLRQRKLDLTEDLTRPDAKGRLRRPDPLTKWGQN